MGKIAAGRELLDGNDICHPAIFSHTNLCNMLIIATKAHTLVPGSSELAIFLANFIILFPYFLETGKLSEQ